MNCKKVKEFINKLPLTSAYKEDIYKFLEDMASNSNSDVSSFSKITNYLYEVNYNKIDYDFAKKYYNDNGTILPISGCSSINFDNYFARNFDLIYDDRTTIVVRTQGSNNTYKTLGVCSYEQLTKSFIQSGKYNDIYKLLPFIITDGINSNGLLISTNVVPQYHNLGDVTPLGEVKDIIYVSMVVRYILDHCANVSEAVTMLKENLVIKTSKWGDDNGFDFQFIISDNTTSKIINFKDNRVVDTDGNYITNFAMCGVELNNDGGVYTPVTSDDTHKPSLINKIQPNGQGLERFNLIKDAYSSVSDVDDIVSLLESLEYTNAYTITEPEAPEDEDDEPLPNNVWYTEFTGLGGNTIDSTPERFADILEIARLKFANRSKDKRSSFYGTWETIHSSIYNKSTKSLQVYLHEDFTKSYTFNF